MDELWISVAVFVAYCAAVCAVVVRQKVLDRRRHRRAAERRLLAFKARRARMQMDWDDLLREGEPTDDEIYNPPYAGHFSVRV